MRRGVSTGVNDVESLLKKMRNVSL
jgi:hypothetical protein